LTGARLGEVTKATWSEINLERRLWTVPADHMKMKKEHKVPLSDAAVALLASLPRVGDDFRIFDVGDQTVRDCLNSFKRTAKVDGKVKRVTVHGFRSAFRTWAQEATDFPAETIEHCLAHLEGSAAELAYKRGEDWKNGGGSWRRGPTTAPAPSTMPR
jgi:integrase